MFKAIRNFLINVSLRSNDPGSAEFKMMDDVLIIQLSKNMMPASKRHEYAKMVLDGFNKANLTSVKNTIVMYKE